MQLYTEAWRDAASPAEETEALNALGRCAHKGKDEATAEQAHRRLVALHGQVFDADGAHPVTLSHLRMGRHAAPPQAQASLMVWAEALLEGRYPLYAGCQQALREVRSLAQGRLAEMEDAPALLDRLSLIEEALDFTQRFGPLVEARWVTARERGYLSGVDELTALVQEQVEGMTERGFALAVWVVLGGFMILRDAGREVQVGRLRSELVANVSHELRTPLTTIRMYAETLLIGRHRSEKQMQDYLTTLLHESRRLSRLVDIVLDFARIERGERTYQRQPCDLGTWPGRPSRRWKFRLEVDGPHPQRHYSAPEFDDTDWSLISIGRAWEDQGYAGYDAGAWTRNTRTAPRGSPIPTGRWPKCPWRGSSVSTWGR